MRTAEQRKIENKNENLFVLLHPARAHIVVNPWIKESAPASVPQKGLSPCRITTSDPNTYLSLPKMITAYGGTSVNMGICFRRRGPLKMKRGQVDYW